MLSSLSLLLVTWSLFQAPAQRVANNLLPDSPGQPHATPDKPPITPELRGDIFMARKMYREAIEAYKLAPSDSAVVLNKTGIAHQQLLELDQARHYYQLAVKIDPKYAEAINNIGTIYYANKSYRRAITQYEKALQITPEAASIVSNLGTAYFARGKYKEAIECVQRALELDPDVYENQSTVGVLLQDRSVQDRGKMNYYLAKAYASKGMTDRALQSIRKSLEEGFKDREKYMKEPEFAALRDNAEFKKIMATEQKVL